MLENYLTQVRRSKAVSSEREAFVSRAAQASAAACQCNNLMQIYQVIILTNTISTYIFVVNSPIAINNIN